MSNYIRVDLKVIEVLAPMVARAASISEDRALAGLVRLWHRCWSTTSDTVTMSQLAGIFGGERIEALAEVLCADFLERIPEGFRVRGADGYLRLKEARRSGALKTNEARNERRSKSVAERALPNALSPNTEHRAPNTEHREEEAPPPPQPTVAVFELKRPDIETIESWVKEDFWRAAEITRREAGFPPEKWPNPVALSRWWGEAQQVADTRALADAFVRFIADKHWRAASPPCPWAAFAKQYLNFIPSRGAA